MANLINIEHMLVVSLTQAKINFYDLVEKATKGEVVVITKYGKRVVKLVARKKV